MSASSIRRATDALVGAVAFRLRFITKMEPVTTIGWRISKGLRPPATSGFMIGCAASHRLRRGGGSCESSPSDRRPR